MKIKFTHKIFRVKFFFKLCYLLLRRVVNTHNGFMLNVDSVFLGVFYHICTFYNKLNISVFWLPPEENWIVPKLVCKTRISRFSRLIVITARLLLELNKVWFVKNKYISNGQYLPTSHISTTSVANRKAAVATCQVQPMTVNLLYIKNQTIFIFTRNFI